jgi:hypothetical protein
VAARDRGPLALVITFCDIRRELLLCWRYTSSMVRSIAQSFTIGIFEPPSFVFD